MATGPSFGGHAKLAFKKQTNWTTYPTFAAATGHLIALDSWADNSVRNPADVREVGTGIDYTTFVDGESVVGATVTFAMRHSGIHALMLANAVGSITYNGGASPKNVQVAPADAIQSIGFSHQPSFGPTAGTRKQIRWIGMKAASMSLSHRQGDVLRVSQTYLGYDRDYLGGTLDTLPSDTDHVISAADGYVNWSEIDLTASGSHINEEGQAAVRIVPQSWRIDLNNGLRGAYAIGDTRRSFEPIRDGIRECRFTAEIAMDDGWDEMIDNIHGANEAAAGKSWTAYFKYVQKGTSGTTAKSVSFKVANMRSMRVLAVTPGPQVTWATIEGRAQYVTGAAQPDIFKAVVELGSSIYDPSTNW